MEFSAEALRLLLETGQAAKAVETVPHVPDPRRIHVRVGSELQTIDVPPPLRKLRVDVLADLVDLAVSGDTFAEIWHDGQGLVAILCATDRRESAELVLKKSDRFLALEFIGGGHLFDQRELMSFLRLRLGVDESVIACFRRLTWSTGGTSRGDVHRGKESLGKEVMAAVEQVAELPELIRYDCPVYDLVELDFRACVAIAVEVDVMNQRVLLRPMPDELSFALQHAQQALRAAVEDLLAVESVVVPVYAGRPNL